ncbi:MAG: hypothetical protein AAF351_01820 [Pseudomonadota bacterium]
MNVTRSLSASAASIAFVAALVIGLALLQYLNDPSDDIAPLQRIDMAATVLPPPPPPSQRQRKTVRESVQLELGQSNSSALKLPPARVQQTLSIEDLEAPLPSLPPPDFDMNLNATIQEFGLAQLDNRPRLLTTLSIRFPESLRRQGVTSVSIQAQVVIDQSGTVTLRRLIDNPYSELEPQIRDVMRRARFTPPEKDGRRVRAAFVWPLVLQSE